jgi:hypothetical protein
LFPACIRIQEQIQYKRESSNRIEAQKRAELNVEQQQA